MNKDFIGVCQGRVLPPDNLFVPCLAHKMDGKLLFCLYRTCASNGQMQRIRCSHNERERSWIDVYTSIDNERALLMGYKILEYKEIWHYHGGGGKVFRDFILNIVKRKTECSGFPRNCNSDQSKEDYIQNLKKQCSIDLRVDDIRKDPAGPYLNKIMANSVWGKWAPNPSTQSSLTTCGTIREYHEKLLIGRVKRVSLVSKNLMQVEMRCDRSIESENRESNNNRSGLGGRNTIVGAFVTATVRDLMYSRYLSKLKPDQLLYTDTNSVIVYFNKNNPLHVEVPTSDMLGNLKDEYGETFSNHPNWYIHEFMVFGPKMYQLILRDLDSGKVVRWDKTMKGISMKGNMDLLSVKVYLYIEIMLFIFVAFYSMVQRNYTVT